MASLLWLQTVACSGDSMSLLNAEHPNLIEALDLYGVELLWHPSLALTSVHGLGKLIAEIQSGKRPLDLLAIEGAIAFGPDGTGMFDPLLGRAKKDLVADLARMASYVVAIGTCAAFGGVAAAEPNPTDSCGMQWLRGKPGGLLPSDWRSQGGLPVVNIPGCPSHPNAMLQTLIALLLGADLKLDELNRPADFFGRMVHSGCTRNEFHEYDIEEHAFGGPGCLFFNLGCQGPNTQGPCNTVMWNGESSKTRRGVPCMGCTGPDFPKNQNLFMTDVIGKIPVTLPLGVRRSNYMAYKGLARAAAPKRLLPVVK